MVKVSDFIFLLILAKPILSESLKELIEFYQGHYYSASVLGLVDLLKLEQEFMENFTIYTDALQEKVDNLNNYLDALKRPNHTTHNDREKFVSNPLNAFGLIRRLNQDWPKWQNYAQKSVGIVQINAMEKILSKKPKLFDMNESLRSMHRIEVTYDLSAKDIARGLLQGTQFNYTLSVGDCLALANHTFEIGNLNSSLQWFQEAVKQFPDNYEDISSSLKEDQLKEFATIVATRSLQMMNQSIGNETLHKLVRNQLQNLTKKDMENFISSKLVQWQRESVSKLENANIQTTAHNIGCRGLFPKRKNLVCRYNSTTNAFLKLAPLKMEEISRDPYIVMYHKVLSDREIEEMKGEVKEWSNGWTGLEEPMEIVSLVYWTTDESKFRDRINQRISDMTGFKLEEFPALQLANFGIGGYFKPHYDYFTERLRTLDANNTLGDRLGSLLFYAGEVSQGGQTVFPEVEVAVEPKKGNALFWFNDFDDSSPDPRSLHSVCPVIIGSRWTITKWLHHDPQVFVKPCSPRILKRSS